MTILDRYVLQQVGKPLMVSLVIGLLMLMAERFVRILDLTLGKKGSLGLVFEMLSYLVPHYLGLAIPASIFLGLLFGYNQMSRNAEIDACLASGISLHRITRPVIALSLLIALFTIFIFGWLQPYTRYAYRAIKYAVQNVDVYYLAEEGVFMQTSGRTFILDKLDRRNQRFYRIFVFETKKGKMRTITARSGFLVRQQRDPRPLLVLLNGHQLEIKGIVDPTADKLPKASSKLFSRAETPIGRKDALTFRPRGLDERELTLPELVATLNTPRKYASVRELRAEFHKRVVSILTILVLPFLAIPFAVGQRRQQRAYRFAVALAILIAYEEALHQGAVAARQGVLPIWVGIWLPWILLTIFAAVRYYRTCFTLRSDMFEVVYQFMSRLGERLRGLLPARWRRKQGETA